MSKEDEYFKGAFAQFHDYREKGLFCDTVLVTGQKGIRAHSLVLGAGSSVLRDALKSKVGSSLRYIYLPDYDFDILRTTVNFLYTGRLLVDSKYRGENQRLIEFKASIRSLGLNVDMIETCEVEYESSVNQQASALDHTVDFSNFLKHKTLPLSKSSLCELAKLSATESVEDTDKDVACIGTDSQQEEISEDNLASRNMNSDIPTGQTDAGYSVLVKQEAEGDVQYVQQGEPDNLQPFIIEPMSDLVSGEPMVIHLQTEDGEEMECSYISLTEQDYIESVVQTTINGELCYIVKQEPQQSISKLVKNEEQDGNKPGWVDKSSDGFEVIAEAESSNVLEMTVTKDGSSYRRAIKPGRGKALQTHVRNMIESVVEAESNDAEAGSSDLEAEPSDVETDSLGPEAEDWEELDDTEIDKTISSSRNKKNSVVRVVRGPFVCTQCKLTFATMKGLNSHKLIHRDKTKQKPERKTNRTDEGNYTCEQCGKMFSTLVLLKKHLRAEHDISRKFECRFCGSTFTTLRVLQTHERSHTGERPVLCHLCGRSFTELRLLRMHLKTPHDQLACPTCGKMCTSRANLAVHSMSEHGIWLKARIDKPRRRLKDGAGFLCDTCGRSFSTNSSMMTHHARTHRRMCEVCGVRLEGEEQLKEHMRDVHPGVELPRRNWCEICDKELATEMSFHEHMRRHSNERPFSCVKCAKTFIARSRLVLHLQKVHGSTGGTTEQEVEEFVEKTTYPCEQCGKVFRWPHARAAHMAIHTGELPYQCKYCDKRFLYSASLYAHIRIHTGELPYPCNLCNKRFRQASHAKRHMYGHRGIKQHICQLCGKGYMGRVDLRHHYTRVHNLSVTQTRLNARYSYTFHLPEEQPQQPGDQLLLANGGDLVIQE